MAVKVTAAQLATIAALSGIDQLSRDLELSETADQMLAVTTATGKTTYVYPDGQQFEPEFLEVG